MLHIWRPAPTDPASAVAFIIGAVLFFALILFARVRAGRSQGGDARSYGSWVGAFIQGAAIALAGGPVIVRPGMADPARTIAVALLMTASVGLFAWSVRTMGRNWAIVARTRADHGLVTTGPFAFVRNPIYVAMAFFMLGFTVATGHEPALILAAPVFVIGTLIRTMQEERLLRAHFGAAYEDYAARVKRFVPGVF
ncbi:MAG: isoprenylcysteine carboxylmethyltransferase family protein [Sphingomonadaceae bacterium]|nr:isoprenylcysteine carboxylmethyltransferase family protein [Sphingomonadaceae bacterium]